MQKIIYILLPIILAACSANVTKNNADEQGKVDQVSYENQSKAQDHFISGAIFDLKGQYAAAILEYQEALTFDGQAGIHYALSKDYLILNKLPSALKHSKVSVEMAPDDVEYNYFLGNVYKIAQQPDSAEVVFNKVIELDSTYYQAYYSLGQVYEPKKPLKALEVYETLLKMTGPEWSVLVKIADLNERMGNVDNTISTVEELLSLNPSNLQLQKLLIESYLKTKRTEEALVMIDDALVMFPDDLSLIEYKGNALAQESRWQEASKEYNKLIHSERIPFEAKKRIAAGFVTEAAKDSAIIPIAKNVLHEIEKDSTDWQISAFLGEIASTEGNDSLAIEYFKSATNDAPWNPQIWNRLGILLFESQNYEMTVEEMKKAVNQFPDDFIDNLILGLALSQQQDTEGASRALEHAVRLNPNDITALNAYGFTLNQQNRTDAAVVYLEKVLYLDSTNIQALSTLAMIYDGQNDFVQSDSLYERALLIDSTNALIANNYAYSLSERGIQLERALRLAEFAVEENPENSSYLDTIGWVLYKLENYAKAEEYIKKAIEYDDSNATLFDHLADIYKGMNKIDKAKEYWKKALEIDPTLTEIEEKLNKS
ncbi:MAG: tetratricopeptide repeat protein [Bacteroidota bacterium]